jgi:NADH-quinone oxidoreductase subunit A
MRHYLPALVFLLLGIGLGTFFAFVNAWLGARTRRRDQEPYECGLPSDGAPGSRFSVSFYLVGILFLIFDLEVILLITVALQLEIFGWHALGAIGVFLALLGVAFVYEWRRGSLDWEHGEGGATRRA